MNPTRNICIGTVYRDGLLVELGQLRTRKCLSVNWRGTTSVFQPFQFLEEAQVVAAVRGRLATAGLSLLRWEIKREPGRGDYEPIRCVVGRLRCPHSRAVQENMVWRKNKELMNADEKTAVLIFAQRMQAKLVENMHKGGRENWLKDPVADLLARLGNEVVELEDAIAWADLGVPAKVSVADHAVMVANECADIANFAMMISDWYLERAKAL
jgi:hypothetical protein